MSGHADGDTRETGGHDRGHERGLGQHEGERAWPECLREHEGGGVDNCEFGEVRDRLDVHDQRVGLGARLCEEDLLAGGGVEGVGGETVDGFGRSGDESARAQHAGECREIAWRARVGARAEWAWANGGKSL